MRKPYSSPEAELICFAPAETIATNSGWGSDKSGWTWGDNHWSEGLGTDLKSIGAGASIVGGVQWYDDLSTDPKNKDLD